MTANVIRLDMIQDLKCIRLEKSKREMDKEQILEECVKCRKETPLDELEENSKYLSYGCKLICNKCASKIDADIDAQEQDKS